MKILIMLLAVFFCFGYMTGSDWRQYEPHYEFISSPSSDLDFILFEPGYVAYSYIFGIIGIGFWPFFIFTKVLLFQLIVRSMKQMSFGTSQLFSLFFFLFYFGLFLFIDNPMRNLIAVVISLFAYKPLIERNFKSYLLIILMAMSFHASAALLLIFYWFYPIKISNRNLIILYVVLTLIFTKVYQVLILYFGDLFAFMPFIGRKMNYYFIEGEEFEKVPSWFSLGTMFQLLIFSVILIMRKDIEKIKYGHLIFWGTISYLFLYRLGLLVDLLYRLQLYFSILYSVCIGSILWMIKKRSLKQVFFCFLASYLFLVLIQTVTSSEKYIPYSNYLDYIFQRDLSFDKRSQYNINNSPYVKK